jgi:hypothetical protein
MRPGAIGYKAQAAAASVSPPAVDGTADGKLGRKKTTPSGSKYHVPAAPELVPEILQRQYV